MKKFNLLLIVSSLVLVLVACGNKKQEKGLEIMENELNATYIDLYENDYGKFIKVENTVASENDLYLLCKNAIPIFVKENLNDVFSDVESFVIVSKIVDIDNNTSTSQAIPFNFKILDKIDWNKAKNFDSLFEQISILNIRYGN